MARRIAIIGTGVIGTGWVTCFLARGLEVTAYDPAPNAEERSRKQVAQQWVAAEALGLAPGASIDRLKFFDNVRDAVAGAEFVQESGPEQLELKRTLFAEMDAAAPANVILASSSSGIPASLIQTACKHPERVLIGHPFHPPHLIPLVEVVGGKLTTPAMVQAALDFYTEMGKRPIRIEKEMKGFVTNRLQAALWREAYGLVHAGVASVEDIDTAIANGPGLRWSLLGPFATQKISGGAGGLAKLLDHLGPPMDEYWQDLLPTRLTPEVKAAVLASMDAKPVSCEPDDVTRERDRLLVALLRMKAQSKCIT